MPIYAFRCAACGHAFDRLQKLSDADPDTCPECGAVGEVGRQLTAPSFRLAGSGWYETDFKKDGDRKRNLAEGGEGAGKADAKPDAKPDAAATPAKDAPAKAPAAKAPATPSSGATPPPATP
ncbi:zinc ribbon domain-containing protein [Luteimonas sp. MJ204]|uniref:FmdB family zinc ribbon protein n=1 Tax=Luteimonas sp. MJ145 TaxID=3129234 RepID=UPI0031BB74A8